MLVIATGAKRISSRSTSFYKRVFPVLWISLLAGVLLLMTFVSRRSPGVPLVAFLVPALMMVLGYFLFRKLLSDLVDEVWDNGHELIVVNDGHVEHVPLSNIMNVSYSGFTNPKFAIVQLRQPGRWGEKLRFIPQQPGLRLSLFTVFENEIVDDLIRRVDAARRAG
jgi:hypothetical protein